MSKHTPGPWVITNHGSVDAKDRQIALVSNGGIIDMPNARLIAAAPDSHEANMQFVIAVEEMLRITAEHSDDWIYDEMPSSSLATAYFAARAAIAKANGE